LNINVRDLQEIETNTKKEKEKGGIFQSAFLLSHQKKESIQTRFIILCNEKQGSAEGIKTFLLTISRNIFFNALKFIIFSI